MSDNQLLNVLLSLLAIVSLLLSFGIVKSQIDTLRKQIQRVEREADRIRSMEMQLSKLRDQILNLTSKD